MTVIQLIFTHCAKRVTWVCLAAAPLVLLLAGLLKLNGQSEFAITLSQLQLVPAGLAEPLSGVIPALELLPFTLLLTRRPIAGQAMAAGLIALFTAVYSAEFIRYGEAPACGCMGLLRQWKADRADMGELLTRNGLLLAWSLSALVLTIRRRTRAKTRTVDPLAPIAPASSVSSASGPSIAPGSAPAHRGFSLIELLVTIAIIGVLLGITLPAVGAVRGKARLTAADSALRQHAAAITAYAGDHRGDLPYFTVPGQTTILTGSGTSTRAFFWWAHSIWHIPLGTPYLNLGAHDEMFADPRRRDPMDLPWSDYLYPCSMIADSGFWARETRIGRSQYGPQRLANVAFPSKKSLVVLPRPVDSYFPYRFAGEPDPLSRLAFADASVNAPPPEEHTIHSVSISCITNAGPSLPSINFIDGALHRPGHPWAVHTERGIMGIDVR